MSLSLIVFGGFYEPARHAVHYADTLAQALGARLVLLHVNRASQFDPYALMGESYRQQELARQADATAALYRLVASLSTPTAVEIATDLLPAVAQQLAARYAPALFVLGVPEADHPAAATLAPACVELLRAGHFPLLLVPPGGATARVPHRFLIAADREPFALAPAAQPLRHLLDQLATDVVVAHVTSGVEDDAGCGLAQRAVLDSGLAGGLVPELRGYEHDDYVEGLLAAVADTRADLVLLVARQRSYLGELFHRSVTARLLKRCPVPVLLLPAAAEAPPAPPTAAENAAAARTATVAQVVNGVFTGLSPAS